ncbi:alpha/beta hydrolase [Bradyrhizobium sp. SRS-191]|uniref:alpha/beta hydrolase n=1 Tax=Bradyrhizobium sp. SRS-191 TaxID=2962606 RepID=UPI00211F256A|nr:alpha/beta hydrolase [Bradyrhizobium sp. SRS-191]
MMSSKWALTALLGVLLFAAAALGSIVVAQDETAANRPVAVVAEQRLAVGDRGVLPLYASRPWTVEMPDITRAVLVLHGRLRNANVYFETAKKAQAAAGPLGAATLLIVPQFLAQADIEPHHLPDDILRWQLTGWQAGDAALGPRPVSSFEALDAILAHLANRALFPALAEVVIAGHSGGGQMVQRYAIAGRGEAALAERRVSVRYVVANPSSYAYFSASRPEPAIAAACPGYDDWKYGMAKRPAYLADATPAQLETTYVSRRVIYLLGTRDTDPDHPALDKTCMAKAQGASRHARGHAYAAAMAARPGGTPRHQLWDVVGVGHNGNKMLTSPCGLKALFDMPGCEASH